MNVSTMTASDAADWLTMRNELWPGELNEHRSAIDSFFVGHGPFIDEAYICRTGAGDPAGFIELRMRNYAEGSEATAVPYVEGWFVDNRFRRQGLGRRLMEQAEQWALAQGCYELASDTELDNQISIAAHTALGFSEVERAVCFLKQLPVAQNTGQASTRWGVCPVLGVRDVAAATEFLKSRLGFIETDLLQPDDHEPAVYAIVKRGGIELHLQIRRTQLDTEREAIENDVYIRVPNVDELRQEFIGRGAQILKDIMDQPYGMRDFCVSGPEHHRLMFATANMQTARH
jgi:aminoglycoside 6'-N-acetyltransferase I